MQQNNILLSTLNKYLIHIALFGFVGFGLFKVVGIGIQYGVIGALIVSGIHFPMMIFSYVYFIWADDCYGVHPITATALFSTCINEILI